MSVQVNLMRSIQLRHDLGDQKERETNPERCRAGKLIGELVDRVDGHSGERENRVFR